MPNQFLNAKGVQQVFERIQIILSKNEAEEVLADVRRHFNGRFECSFKDFLDFMTRRRINSAFSDKGFVDPMIAQCCQVLAKSANTYDISFEQIFNIFDSDRRGILPKDIFMKCLQGMELGIAAEDLNEFFNFMDDKSTNALTKLQFVDSVTFVTSKIGGGNKLEQALSQGVNQTKKGHSVKQQVFNILKKLSDAIQNKRLAMRQVIGIFDQGRTGYVSRAEFAQTVKGFEGGITLDEARVLMAFFDDRNTGKLSVVEIVRTLQEIMSTQSGGGLYAFMQVQPILQKIINELAIDCDKFFDEVAELNEQQPEEDSRQRRRAATHVVGLSKRLLYQQLQRYGVQLDEDEKTLINTVFSLADYPDKFDYERLDAAFEGVQQQLYAQGKLAIALIGLQ